MAELKKSGNLTGALIGEIKIAKEGKVSIGAGVKVYDAKRISSIFKELKPDIYASPSPPPKGGYHFIVIPCPAGSVCGGGSWHLSSELVYPVFFEEEYLNGKRKKITSNIPDLGIGVAASIHVPKEYIITIYESKSYQGKARTFYHAQPGFGEDFWGGSAKIRNISGLDWHDKDIGKDRDVISPADMDEILNAHNEYRSKVGVPLLVWDEQLAASAKKWANHLAATGKSEHSGPGENLAWGNISNWTEAVDLWGSEQICFKNDIFPNIYNGKCDGDPDCPKNWMCAGHYSQIVWRNTQRVGGGRSGNYYVCQYSPAGNVMGRPVY